MNKNNFDRALTVVFHAVAICTVTIAAVVGASLLRPDDAPAADSIVQNERASAAKSM